MIPENLLRLLLLTCSVFFMSMATAHFFGIKLPILFVYFDTPFYAYQDRIISFSVVTYALLFLAASRHTVIVPYALASFWVTILGLSYINQSTELSDVLPPSGGTGVYWLITAAFTGLAIVLTLLWLKDRKVS